MDSQGSTTMKSRSQFITPRERENRWKWRIQNKQPNAWEVLSSPSEVITILAGIKTTTTKHENKAQGKTQHERLHGTPRIVKIHKATKIGTPRTEPQEAKPPEAENSLSSGTGIQYNLAVVNHTYRVSPHPALHSISIIRNRDPVQYDGSRIDVFRVLNLWRSDRHWKRKEKGAATWQNQQNVWHPPSLIRVFACALNGKLRTHAFFMRIAKTLIRLGGCWAHNHFVGFVMSRLKCILALFWGPPSGAGVGTCFLCFLEINSFVPLFPKIKIFIFYIPCSKNLHLFPVPLIFRPLFHCHLFSSNKCPCPPVSKNPRRASFIIFFITPLGLMNTVLRSLEKMNLRHVLWIHMYI